jgi:hypothetical protein
MAKDNIVLRWNTALLQAVKNTKMRPPAVARAIAMLHTATYDAWSHYDGKALPVHTPSFQRVPPQYRSDKNREKAIAYAAFNTCCDLFPKDQSPFFSALMNEYAFDTRNTTQEPYPSTGHEAAAIGNLAASGVLEFRHEDNSNQQNGYADTSGSYAPKNTADELKDINHWQPLKGKNSDGTPSVQSFLYPHWGLVKAFAVDAQAIKPLPTFDKYPRPLPVKNHNELTVEEQKQATVFEKGCKDILDISKNLDDRSKIIAEYWEGGAGSVTPPGIWAELARQVSLRDCNDLNKDVKLFFILGNTLLDVSIACWYAKVRYDFCRPITAIHAFLKGTEVEMWGGAYQGIVKNSAEKWQPYLSPTPPFSEYVSGHSSFSSGSAEILKLFTNSDYFGSSVTVKAGNSRIEGGLVPASDIKLEWKKFSEAAEQAGLSRLYGGIHFAKGNTEGLALGRRIATIVWAKAQEYCNGTIKKEIVC